MNSKLKTCNTPIRKALYLALILLLSLSTYATALATAPGCDSGACMKGAMGAGQATMTSTSTAMPFNCCAGMQGATCDFEKGQKFDIPDVTLSPVRLPIPDSLFGVDVAIDHLSENPPHRGFGPYFQHRRSHRSAPIYLTNLSLLF